MYNIFKKRKPLPNSPSKYDHILNHIGEEATYNFWGKEMKGKILEQASVRGLFWMSDSSQPNKKERYLASGATIKITQ